MHILRYLYSVTFYLCIWSPLHGDILHSYYMCMYSCRAGRLGSQAALVFYGAPPLITTNCRWAPAHFLNTSDESVYLYSSSCSYKSCKIFKNTAKTTAIVWGWRGACSELNRSIHYVFTASGNLVTIHLGWCMASCEASAFLHIKNVKTEDINLQFCSGFNGIIGSH